MDKASFCNISSFPEIQKEEQLEREFFPIQDGNRKFFSFLSSIKYNLNVLITGHPKKQFVKIVLRLVIIQCSIYLLFGVLSLLGISIP